MSIIINGTNVPSSGNIFIGNVDLDKVICNGVTVWKKQKDIHYTSSDSSNISGAAWSVPETVWYDYSEYHSKDETYTIAIQIDLTSYKRIIANVSTLLSATVSNTGIAIYQFRLDSGQKSSQLNLRSFHQWVESGDDYTPLSQDDVLSWDVSGITGNHTVYLDTTITHYPNQDQWGNLRFSYSVRSIDFKTT